ncbi:hypothetical protein G9A89_007297 [Geosiphon pyriformis]|nr:hypothetical protein G9A89_007297 [Geosiphon pyriformis]
MTNSSRPTLCLIGTPKNYNSARIRKKRKNSSGKLTKSCELILITIIYYQYLHKKKKEKGKKKKKKKLKPPSLAHVVVIIRTGQQPQNIIVTYAFLNNLDNLSNKKNETTNHAWLVKKLFLTKEYGITFLKKEKHDLALTREEQKQYLEQLNTQLCDHCLIPYDFQYCNKCNLIYNPLPCMIYMISEEKKPISNCALKSELMFNSGSNSNNNDNKNNKSSSIQNCHENNNNLDSNSNPKQYIMLFNLTKEQKFKWFSNNNEGIMPKHTHDTNTGFDLRYPRKEVIKLELYLHICINLKVALEILTKTIVQLASKSSLAKKEINIKKGIIDTEYVENIITILQNDLEKTYIIEPNEKITQAIFFTSG